MRLRFAISGCGKIAQRHAALIRELGDLVAVCDIHQGRLHTMATATGAAAFVDVEKMCSEVRPDVLVVCTPNGLHCQHTIIGFSHGCHVICEKPMALSVHDGEEMILASRKAKRHLFIVKQNRYNPPVVALAEMINGKRLGKIAGFQMNGFWNRDANYYTDDWRGSLTMDGGILFTQFSHFIDLVCWLFGESEALKGTAANQFHRGITEFADTIFVNAHFSDNVLGSMNFTTNTFFQNMEGSLIVFGEKGTIKIGGQYLNTLEYAKVDGAEEIRLLPGSPANEYGFYTGSMSNHHLVYRNVLEVLQKNEQMDILPEDGLKTVALIEKIHKCINDVTPKK